MKISLLILAIVCALSCGVAHDEKRNDHANLQGVWLAQTESQNGINKNVSYVYVFKEDKITFIDETGKEINYSFKLDTISNPRLMIIQPDTLIPSPVSVAYQLSGDSLTIVVAPPGSRPTEISDKHDQELIICKRKGS